MIHRNLGKVIAILSIPLYTLEWFSYRKQVTIRRSKVFSLCQFNFQGHLLFLLALYKFEFWLKPIYTRLISFGFFFSDWYWFQDPESSLPFFQFSNRSSSIFLPILCPKTEYYSFLGYFMAWKILAFSSALLKTSASCFMAS